MVETLAKGGGAIVEVDAEAAALGATPAAAALEARSLRHPDANTASPSRPSRPSVREELTGYGVCAGGGSRKVVAAIRRS
jgi:hypothetical protein